MADLAANSLAYSLRVTQKPVTRRGIEILQWQEFDAILLGLKQSDPNILEIVRKIRRTATKTPILCLFDQPDFEKLSRLREAGIMGAITLSPHWRDLHTAIYHIWMGWQYYSPGLLAPNNLSTVQTRKFRGIELKSLSAREQETLKWIAMEYTNQEIALKLEVGKRTIDKHREHLLYNLRVANTVGLTKAALAFGLVELE